jgi:hypothetical protein
MDPACARCHWGLAAAVGPTPNQVAAPLGAPYPSFDPASAQEAAQHARHAADAATAARSSGRHAAAVLQRDERYIQAMLARFE